MVDHCVAIRADRVEILDRVHLTKWREVRWTPKFGQVAKRESRS